MRSGLARTLLVLGKRGYRAGAGCSTVDLSGRGPFDIRDGAVGPGMEDRGADAFGFEQPDHGLHQRVIERIGHGPDRAADTLKIEMLGECDGRVLTGLNRLSLTLALPGRRQTWGGSVNGWGVDVSL